MTILTGLIGSGISHSLSPAIHESEAASLGIDLEYRLYDVPADQAADADLDGLLRTAESDGAAGVNITFPFKQRIIPHLTDLSDDARQLGAVNTVVLKDGGRIGHNTDWFGFADGLQRSIAAADMTKVVQVGAGGAGAATAFAALRLGAAELLINDVDAARVEALVGMLSALFPASHVRASFDAEEALNQATGIIQASPIGMVGHAGMPVPARLLRPSLWVIDIIYAPRETELLRAAREAGCRTANGLGMVVSQAARALALFTGAGPSIERMLARI